MQPDIGNSSELEVLLDEPEESVDEYDDEVTITVNKKIGFAKPFATNTDGLIKIFMDVDLGFFLTYRKCGSETF